MKKKLLSLALALALCFGLTLPAFAADQTAPSMPAIQFSLPGGAPPQFSASTYQIRQASTSQVTLADKTAYITARSEEPEEFSLSVCELPLGTTITVSNLRGDWSNESGKVDILGVQAYSDPDGDGVYDQWIYNFDNTPPVAPFTEDSVVYPASESGKYYHQAFFTSDNTVGLDTSVLPSSVTFSTDYLNEVFGPNTLVLLQFQVWTVINPDSVTALPTGSSGTLALLVAGEKTAGTPTVPAFTDVPAGQWYAAPVAWAVEKSITNGTSTTTFSPDQDCTQAQILTFLYRAARSEGTATAEDMDKAIGWAREKGMIDSSFDSNKPCTHSTAVSYIWQAFDQPTAKASSFTDVPVSAAYAKAVDWAVEKGITKGDGSEDTFAPDKVCTRGHIVTFLYRAYNN